MARRLAKVSSSRFVVHHDTHPQTIAVLRTRAEPIGIDVVVGDVDELDGGCFGALFSLPTSTGAVTDWRAAIERVHAGGGLAIVATDLLACVLTTPPGQLGADIAVGSAQRFGVPMMFGGPHAAFIAAHEDAARALPGRIVGVSTDTAGRPGAAPRAADPRAAHPPREGDVQHLHGAGAAGQRRRLLRRLPRARRPAPHRRAHAPHGVDRRRRAARGRAHPAPRLVVRHRSPSTASTPTPSSPRPARPTSTSAASTPRPSACRSTRRRRSTSWRACCRRSAPTLDPARVDVAPGRPRRRRERRVPDPVSVRALPHRARDAALPAAPRRRRPGARPHDDPARVVHDEAQRDDRDGLDHVARVRRPPPVRPATTSRRACGR